jgi:pyruvate formate lyase activating enzyme
MREVEFYREEAGKLVCELCPHRCRLRENQKGVCRQRQRVGDKLVALNYAQVASLALDPIEKKPLYHFHPGSVILSVGANGCNLQCLFCQNCEISQGEVPTRRLEVDELVRIAGTQNSIGVAFTYSEPLMWYEYVLDAAPQLRREGYVVVLVTNGFIEEKPLRKLLPYVDAMNIDLKSMADEFYRRLCKASVSPVENTIKIAHDAGVHVEIAHLVVTGWNDREESILEVARWIASVDPEMPLHLSRYFPHYRYFEPPTSAEFLYKALEIARRELKFVYLGNIAGESGADTLCPDCGSLLIARSGYRIRIVNLKGDVCSQCGRRLPIK